MPGVVNPGLQVIQLSATTGENLQTWIDWIETGARDLHRGQAETVATLRQRIAELEAQLAQPAR